MSSELRALLDRYISEDTGTFRGFSRLEVNTAGHENRTPLHVACTRAAVEDVDILLAGGADVNASDDVGHTPLHCAVFQRSLPIVQRLILAGADSDAVSQFNETPKSIARTFNLTEIEREFGSEG
jgi:ankyrin repeat protein